MVRIAISQAAFDAIAKTLPLGKRPKIGEGVTRVEIGAQACRGFC
jgi:hypothetical protein